MSMYGAGGVFDIPTPPRQSGIPVSQEVVAQQQHQVDDSVLKAQQDFESKNVKLNDGSYVSKTDYDKLSLSDKEYLKSNGINAFNSYKQQQVIQEQQFQQDKATAEFNRNNVKLYDGTYIAKTEYDKLSPDDKKYILENGVNSYNAYKQQQFETNNVKLNDGTYISRTDYDKLTPDNQKYLSEHGAKAFNEYQQQQQQSFEFNNVKLLDNTYVPKEYYDSLTKLAQNELLLSGVDKFNSWLAERQFKLVDLFNDAPKTGIDAFRKAQSVGDIPKDAVYKSYNEYTGEISYAPNWETQKLQQYFVGEYISSIYKSIHEAVKPTGDLSVKIVSPESLQPIAPTDFSKSFKGGLVTTSELTTVLKSAGAIPADSVVTSYNPNTGSAIFTSKSVEDRLAQTEAQKQALQLASTALQPYAQSVDTSAIIKTQMERGVPSGELVVPQPVIYNVNQYIKDNPNQDAINNLKTLGFKSEVIEPAQQYINVINSIVKNIDDKITEASKSPMGTVGLPVDIENAFVAVLDIKPYTMPYGISDYYKTYWDNITDKQKQAIADYWLNDPNNKSRFSMVMESVNLNFERNPALKGIELAGFFVFPEFFMPEAFARQTATTISKATTGQKVGGWEIASDVAMGVATALPYLKPLMIAKEGEAVGKLTTGGKVTTGIATAGIVGVMGGATIVNWNNMTPSERALSVGMLVAMPLMGFAKGGKTDAKVKDIPEVTKAYDNYVKAVNDVNSSIDILSKTPTTSDRYITLRDEVYSKSSKANELQNELFNTLEKYPDSSIANKINNKITLDIANQAGKAHADMNLALKERDLSETSALSSPEMANKVLKAINDARVADQAFIDRIASVNKIDVDTIGKVESQSGYTGLKDAINEVNKAQAELKDAWNNIDKSSIPSKEALDKLQLARTKLEDAIAKFGSIMRVRTPTESIAPEFKGYEMEFTESKPIEEKPLTPSDIARRERLEDLARLSRQRYEQSLEVKGIATLEKPLTEPAEKGQYTLELKAMYDTPTEKLVGTAKDVGIDLSTKGIPKITEAPIEAPELKPMAVRDFVRAYPQIAINSANNTINQLGISIEQLTGNQELNDSQISQLVQLSDLTSNQIKDYAKTGSLINVLARLEEIQKISPMTIITPATITEIQTKIDDAIKESTINATSISQATNTRIQDLIKQAQDALNKNDIKNSNELANQAQQLIKSATATETKTDTKTDTDIFIKQGVIKETPQKEKPSGLKERVIVKDGKVVYTQRQGNHWLYVPIIEGKTHYDTKTDALTLKQNEIPAGIYRYATGKGSAKATAQLLPKGSELKQPIDIKMGWTTIDIPKGKEPRINFTGGKQAREKYLAQEKISETTMSNDLGKVLVETIPDPIDPKRELKIYTVNGDYVRQNLEPSMDFDAGHHWSNEFIPEDEIWISNYLKEYEAYKGHEVSERTPMSKGMDYDKAHERYGNVIEREIRYGDNTRIKKPRDFEKQMAERWGNDETEALSVNRKKHRQMAKSGIADIWYKDKNHKVIDYIGGGRDEYYFGRKLGG